MVKTKKEDLLHGSRHAVRRGRIRTQPLFSHLWDTDISYRFK
jgi:hypothetical protein